MRPPAPSTLSCLYRFEHGSRPRVTHPRSWTYSGYLEIQNPPKRYGIIDLRELSSLCELLGVSARRSIVTAFALGFSNSFLERFELSVAIERLDGLNQQCWSEAIAFGKLNFVAKEGT